MDELTFAQLRAMRERLPQGFDQRLLAPLEHRAFAREYAQESPLLSLGLLGAIPGYQLMKMLGLMQGRSGAQDPLEQIFAGYQGLGQGLQRRFSR